MANKLFNLRPEAATQRFRLIEQKPNKFFIRINAFYIFAQMVEGNPSGGRITNLVRLESKKKWKKICIIVLYWIQRKRLENSLNVGLQILECQDGVGETVQLGLRLLQLLGVGGSNLGRNFGLVSVHLHRLLQLFLACQQLSTFLLQLVGLFRRIDQTWLKKKSFKMF